MLAQDFMLEQRTTVILIGIFILTVILIISSQSVTAQLPTQQKLIAKLRGDAVIPPVKTNGTGEVYFQSNNGTIKYTVNLTNIDKVTLAQLYLGIIGKNGPIVVT